MPYSSTGLCGICFWRRKMDTQTNAKSQRDNWSAWFRTIKKLRLPWLWIIVGLALNLGLNNLLLKLPDMTADLVSGKITGPAVGHAILYYVLMGLMAMLAVAGQVQAQTYSTKKARESVWNKMLSMRMEYFDRNNATDMMSAITNDTSAAVKDLVNILINLIPDVYYVVMALKRIGEYHWLLVVSCFFLFPVKYIYAWVMGRKMQTNSAVLYGKIGELTGYLADRISHLPLIKTYTNEEQESKNGKVVARKLFKANMKLVFLDNVCQGIVSALDVLQKFIVIVIAVILLQQGKIDIAMWLAFFLFAQNLFSNVDAIFDIWIRMKGMQGEFHRIIDVMDGPEEEQNATAEFPETGDIHFKDITFTYPETDQPALDHVSFTVPRGSSLAIVGLCGSGKTTSISLLEQFYHPEEGEIRIGDTDIHDISVADFRRNLAYVQQGAQIFSGVLREAVTYGIDRTITDEEILTAAEKTGFNEYLNLCPEGLDTEVASGGESMSGGQRQRLVLTREVLRGGEIILMDEPTSALDVQVSKKIQDTMDTVFADKTRILVTHDLSFARRYDHIIVMEGGHLVGEGTHEELLAACEVYQKMNENAGEEMAE